MQTPADELDPAVVDGLKQSASVAAYRAYAPYSGFQAGAAVLLENGVMVTGSNVENAAYGLSLCAERAAVARAVAEHGPGIRLRAIAITNLKEQPSPPCGACRQVLSEFMAGDGWIIFRGPAAWESCLFDLLLPLPFTLEQEPEPHD